MVVCLFLNLNEGIRSSKMCAFLPILLTCSCSWKEVVKVRPTVDFPDGACDTFPDPAGILGQRAMGSQISASLSRRTSSGHHRGGGPGLRLVEDWEEPDVRPVEDE